MAVEGEKVRVACVIRFKVLELEVAVCSVNYLAVDDFNEVRVNHTDETLICDETKLN